MNNPMTSRIANAFPLQWPAGWRRARLRTNSRFEMDAKRALVLLREEVRRIGGSLLVISSNIPVNSDGSMLLDYMPPDPGVAVYFQRSGKSTVFACDKYESVRDNLLAIAKTIEAMRGIERWGASEMMERAFSGFRELPATTSEGEDCWKVLNLPPMSPAYLVKLVHHDMVRQLHGRNAMSEEFARVNVARDDALRAPEAAAKDHPRV